LEDALATEAHERFEHLTRRFISEPTITQGTGFGSSPGLRVRGRIFAMLSGDALVVKLPQERVDQLVASRDGTHFDPGHGRVMKEWISVPLDKADEWEALAAEAFAFVERRP
jgi:hypothetical protein